MVEGGIAVCVQLSHSTHKFGHTIRRACPTASWTVGAAHAIENMASATQDMSGSSRNRLVAAIWGVDVDCCRVASDACNFQCILYAVL